MHPGLRAHLLRAPPGERTKPVNPCGASKVNQKDSRITLRGIYSISPCLPKQGADSGQAERSCIKRWHKKSLGNQVLLFGEGKPAEELTCSPLEGQWKCHLPLKQPEDVQKRTSASTRQRKVPPAVSLGQLRDCWRWESTCHTFRPLSLDKRQLLAAERRHVWRARWQDARQAPPTLFPAMEPTEQAKQMALHSNNGSKNHFCRTTLTP